MNNQTALSNLMPDPGSTGVVGKRLNALRSGSSSPTSAFDVLLKKAGAQTADPSTPDDSVRDGDVSYAARAQDRLGHDDMPQEDEVGGSAEEPTPPAPADAWMLQMALRGDNLQDVFDTAQSTLLGLTGQLVSSPETTSPAPISSDALEEPLLLRAPATGSARASHAGIALAQGSDPVRAGVVMAPGQVRDGSLSTSPEIAGPHLDQDALNPNARLSGDSLVAGAEWDHQATLEGAAQILEAQAGPASADPLGQPPGSSISGTSLQSFASAMTGEADKRRTAPTAAASESATRPTLRESVLNGTSPAGASAPTGRQAAASERTRAYADETMSRNSGSIGGLQNGIGAGEVPSDGRGHIAISAATSAPVQPSALASTAPTMATPNLPAGAMSFSQIMAYTHSQPEGYVAARMDTPITDEAFPRVLGLQIGRWTDEGVQQVWLNVHPADMGPVAIQIALDGRQAELNFGAESAAARHIIESSLPELASALQAAGLTLSGGSISQDMPKSRPGPEGVDQPDGRRGAASGSPGSQSQPPMGARAVRARGLVDLYV